MLPVKTFRVPQAVITGSGSSEQVGEELKKLNLKKALIVTDRNQVKFGIIDGALSSLRKSGVAYASAVNQYAMSMRSRKFAALKKTLKPPKVHGDEEGDLLVVGWGSTLGAIEEAVDRIRKEGQRVSSLHLRFLYPLEPGLREIFARFKKVMTIEMNYSDDWGEPLIDEDTRRYAQLAWMLRAETLVDVDCWSRVLGQPVPPFMMEAAIRDRLQGVE